MVYIVYAPFKFFNVTPPPRMHYNHLKLVFIYQKRKKKPETRFLPNSGRRMMLHVMENATEIHDERKPEKLYLDMVSNVLTICGNQTDQFAGR